MVCDLVSSLLVPLGTLGKPQSRVYKTFVLRFFKVVYHLKMLAFYQLPEFRFQSLSVLLYVETGTVFRI